LAARQRTTTGGIAGSRSSGREDATARKVIAVLVGILIVAAMALFIWQFVPFRKPVDPLPQVSSSLAKGVARRVQVSADDTVQTWEGWFRIQGRDRPPPLDLVFFSAARPSPCSGTASVGGPFYCPIDDTVSIDIDFMAALENRLDREARLGTALVTARVVSEHIQTALGMADAIGGRTRDGSFLRAHSLQADCLTGVWAGLATRRLGNVPPGFYGQLVSRARLLSKRPARGGGAAPPALDIFHHETDGEREAAFRTGLTAKDPRACATPAPISRP
jgi:predicted metalloprotease